LSRIRSRTSASPEDAIEVCTAIYSHPLSSLDLDSKELFPRGISQLSRKRL
jgi:hypothetical protein